MATTKVNTEFIAVNAISGTIIADNAITATHIATNSISGTLIQDSGIVTTMIAANNITSTKIVTDGVLTRHIADDQVTEAKLANAINTSIAAKLPLAGGNITGNLGIGQTSPSAPLDLVTSSNVYAAEFTQSNTSNGDGVFISVGSTASADYALTVRSDAGNTSVLAAKANGNVGIGTFSPGATLHVDASGGANFQVSRTGVADMVYIEADGTNGVIRQPGDGALVFQMGGTSEKMRIGNTGKVSWSANGVGNVATQDRDFTFYTEGSTNGVAINSAANRIVFMGGAGSSGTGSDKGYLQLEDQGTAKVVLNSGGDSYMLNNFAVGETASQGSSYAFSAYGDVVSAWFENRSSTAAHEVMIINRKTSHGTMIAFLYNDAEKGTITQSGGNISYNAFMGSHYTEISEDQSTILIGTVMETLDALVENKYEDQKRLVKCKVSDTSESPNVYGVWFDDNQTGQVAALGASFCRINNGVTVSMGDLLVSNGDGTAKVQSDDIIRSKTIGKVTSTVKKETYSDGSYVVPVVLYCG